MSQPENRRPLETKACNRSRPSLFSIELPSRYVVKQSVILSTLTAFFSIFVATFVSRVTDTPLPPQLIAVRVFLPFLIAFPVTLCWFARVERLEIAYRKLQEQTAELLNRASTDPLTGALNRRSFTEQLDIMLARSDAATVLMIDVDYLKDTNDRFGHQVGDIAIVAACDAIQQVVGPDALIARVGGDEFMAYIPSDVSCDKQTINADINHAATQIFRDRTGLDEAVAVTIGVHRYDPNVKFSDLVASADSDLMRSKRARRVRVDIGPHT
jgi:diguanylate cyclase (GGDEF)-like protein